ncbi:MAG: hypothetical protein M1818_000187 [Claussenomyces sp. TS43310]|nr:MAG: hypothetical protein M1818_000187 [Claussenomyces sp. TS43310]
MAHLRQPGDRPTADDLLSKGYWKSTRIQPTSTRHSTSNLSVNDAQHPTTHQNVQSAPSQRRPPRRRSWPPAPSCEDEAVALSEEHPGALFDAGLLLHDEPPSRGAVDQHPVILEVDVPIAEATKLWKEAQVEDSGERRFVLVPHPDSIVPSRNEDGRLPRTNAERIGTRSAQDQFPRDDASTSKASAPILERRKSNRQDLPALQTKLAPEMPAFRRSTSAYSFTPQSKERVRVARTPSADYLLSPDTVPSAKQETRNIHNGGHSPLQHSLKSSAGRRGTARMEKRSSGGSSPAISRPTTPASDKRYSGGSDYTRRDYGEKLGRPQHLGDENGSTQSGRKYSYSTDRSDREDLARTSRASSTHSSGQYYLSSDEELEDSSDSDDAPGERYHRNSSARRNRKSRPKDHRRQVQRTAFKPTTSSLDANSHSQHASPLPSPSVSPSQDPPISTSNVRRNYAYPPSRDVQPSCSRPVSPFSPLLDPPRSASTLKPLNELSGARTASRRTSPASNGRKSSAETSSFASLPIPISARVDLQAQGSVPQYDNDTGPRGEGARRSDSQRSHWQPPRFRPPEQEPPYLERPVGSYRRYSQDMEAGTIPPLPPCPRRTPLRGCIDWLTLPKCAGFNICPSCFSSTIMPTEYGAFFVPGPPRSINDEVVCDFGSQPWYRIAWLLTLKDRKKDLGIMYRIADVLATSSPCRGKHEAVRRWYSVPDPKTGSHVPHFDVCSTCVKSVEALLPTLRSLFVRVDDKRPPDLPRVCDMRFDSKRFVHYFDALERMADSTKSRRGLDTQDFVELVKRYASTPECTRDVEQHNVCWNVITQLPEFTVCDDCYDEVIRPELERRRAIAAMFTKPRQHMPVASCQLYSDRMRSIFQQAVRGDDYKLLAARARERKDREVEYRRSMSEQRRLNRTNPMGAAIEMKKRQAEWAEWE